MLLKRCIRTWMLSAFTFMAATTFAVEAVAQIYDVNGRSLVFRETGSSTSNGVGSSRYYTNVINIDGTQIDARVTITELSNSTVSSFDSTTNPYASSDFLQPNLQLGTGGGYGTLKVEFLNSSGQPVTLQNFYVNTYDLDGAGGDAAGRQFTDFSGFASYAISTGTKIELQSVSGGTRFITTVGGNLTYAPDTNDFNTIRARVYYTSASSVTIKIGDTKAGGVAYFGLDFSVGYEFNNVSVDTVAPVVTADQTFSYVENQVAGAQIAQIAATDAVGITAFRFSPGNSTTSADEFYTIDTAGAVRITAKGVAAGVAQNDWDILPNTFSYNIQAGDAANNWSIATSVGFTVTAAPPTITGPGGVAGAATSAVSVNENQTAVTTLTANRAVTWSITGGADSAKFAIEPSTGVVTFRAAPDFEAPSDADTNNVYVLIVTATDAGGLTALQTLSVTVLDVVDNPPVITGPGGVAGETSTALTVDENQTAVTTLTSNVAASWSITGGTDQAKFSIVPATGVLTFAAAPDYEAPTDADTANTYQVVVTATGSNGLTTSQTIMVTVRNVAEPAPVITGPSGGTGASTSAITVDENQTAVTTLTAGHPVVWAITGGADESKLAIDPASGVVTFHTAPDYEAPVDADTNNVYVVTITATNANNETATQTLSVTVRNLAEPAPVITGPTGGAGSASSAVSVNENQTAVTTLTASQPVSWEITGGADASKLAIDPASGSVTFRVAPDYEAPTDANTDNVYMVIVTATNANNETSTQTLAVTVVNVVEPAPQITGPSGGSGAAASAVSVNENQTAVTTLTANRSVSWAVTGGADASKLAIDASTGVITFRVAPDYEAPTDANTDNVYVVQLTATDANNEASVHVLSVTVQNISETAPVVSGPSGGAGAGASAVSVNENQTAVTTLTASHPVTWEITGGSDAGKLSIDPATGVVTFRAVPDFEAPADSNADNVYVIEIKATDANRETASQTLSVTVLDVAEPAPVLTGPGGGSGAAASAISVGENQTAVATMGADHAVTWAITGGADASKLAIDATTGIVTFRTAPDYEAPTDANADNVYVIEITATDANRETARQTLSVTVLDLSEPAPVLTGPSGGAGAGASAVSVNESETAVTSLSADQAVTWAITGGADASKFTINSANGAVTFITAHDFEAPTDADANNVYVVEITATNANKEASVQTLSVTVLDLVDTSPVITQPNGDEVDGTLDVLVDEDRIEVTNLASSRPVTWAITGGPDRAQFKIAPDGSIKFAAAPDYESPKDADGDNVYVIEVTATDSHGLTAVFNLRIAVENIDDTAPQITGPDGKLGSTSSVIDLQEGLTLVTTFQASEPVTWSLAGGADQALFVIDGTTGELSFAEAPSFEAPKDADKNNAYVVVLSATDAVDNSSEHTLTVRITDVDEVAPRIAAIASELRYDLRTYAFNSLGDMLAFNEGLFRDTGDCMASAAQGQLTPGMQLNEFNQGTSLDWAKTHCTARYRVIANAGASIDHADGDWTRRGLASVRVEHEVRPDVTLGLGLMGSFANDELASFDDSAISDHSLQVNGYLKANLAENLRAGAFLGFGRAWYDFELHQTGFDLIGKMQGRRQVYGAMLSGDVEVGSVLVTTDVILSRATEDLGQATLVGTVDDDTRKVLFAVGDVDMTRISIPVTGEFRLWGNDPTGWQSTLRLSPGLLCEDTNADTSDMTCGYQLGGRLIAKRERGGGGYVDYRIESVDRRTRNIIGVGYQYTFGPANNYEWAFDVTGSVTEDRPDSRAMFTFRARQ